MKRNKLQKTVFSVICIVLAVIMMLSLVITVLPAHAVDETDLERLAEKRAQLEEQLMEQEQVIQGLTENQTLIVFRKAALDKQISLNRETIALIEEQIAVYQELIDRKEEELSAATAAETEQTALLRERIRSMEENDSYSYLAFIFEANSVPESTDTTPALEIVYVALATTHTGNPISAPAAMPSRSSFSAEYRVLTTPAAA